MGRAEHQGGRTDLIGACTTLPNRKTLERLSHGDPQTANCTQQRSTSSRKGAGAHMDGRTVATHVRVIPAHAMVCRYGHENGCIPVSLNLLQLECSNRWLPTPHSQPNSTSGNTLMTQEPGLYAEPVRVMPAGSAASLTLRHTSHQTRHGQGASGHHHQPASMQNASYTPQPESEIIALHICGLLLPTDATVPVCCWPCAISAVPLLQELGQLPRLVGGGALPGRLLCEFGAAPLPLQGLCTARELPTKTGCWTAC